MADRTRNTNKISIVTVLVWVMILITVHVSGEIPSIKLENPQIGSMTGLLGQSISADGDILAIGAPGSSNGAGLVRVYTCDESFWRLSTEVVPADPADNDLFGQSVAISDSTMLVGAYKGDDGGLDSGSAYVFVRSGENWIQQAKLKADDAAAGDYFGYRVALSGDTAVVAAPWDDGCSGAIYVFTRTGSTWSQQAKICPSVLESFDYFGISIALYGDTVVAGAPYDDDKGSNTGAAYVFTRSGTSWTLQATLHALDGATDDHFGRGLAISSDSIFVGADYDDDGLSNSGSAFVFTCIGGNWTQKSKLRATSPAQNALFGASIAASENKLVIGAYRGNDGTIDGGSAIIFNRAGDAWEQESVVTSDKPASFSWFGVSVAISENRVFVGAPSDDKVQANAGAAHAFFLSGGIWTQQSRFDASDAAEMDYYASSVAVWRDTALVGSPGDDDRGNGSGSVYVYRRLTGVWTKVGRLFASDAKANHGFGGRVALCDGTAVITASDGVYVFQRVGGYWMQQTKLLCPSGSGWFGSTLAISGKTIAIGSYVGDGGGPDLGSVFVFVSVNGVWNHEATLTPVDPQVSSYFGMAVRISGDTIIVGASKYGEDDHGAAYVFTRSSGIWTQEAKLTGDISQETFGCSVSVFGDTAVVGACQEYEGSSRVGAAYIFSRTDGIWSKGKRLLASDGTAGDAFGSTVAIVSDTLIVGAADDDDLAIGSGSAYIFVKDAGVWTEQVKLTAPDYRKYDSFCNTLSYDGEHLLVGASTQNAPEHASGAAYIFALNPRAGASNWQLYD